MNPRYEKGNQVIVTPVEAQSSQRDTELELYDGKIGIVTNYYHIQPPGREVFYVYAVRIIDKAEEVILHEDELKPHLK
ncbi:hypothetical protein ACFLYF_02885 [Chloroflexota bacterium]